ncbi:MULTISPECIES: GNAT family N-acetyltransferase [Rhodonellum]|nr:MULTISPECIES: GNAT family N-acetyltransferase [Rhodonellum]
MSLQNSLPNMQDMIVRLVDLPEISKNESAFAQKNILFRRPIAPEKSMVQDWVFANFGQYWSNEVEVAFSNMPPTCFIAQKEGEILGFACYETSSRNFFGPMGTSEFFRGQGIGEVLLVKSLLSMKEMGYAYAIIGGVGPADFYKKAVGATIIKGSEISIYQHLLPKKS